jgi:histidinol-phosphate aminotransferase
MNDSSTVEQRHHGGPDAHGVPLFDFSTNSNACGPGPQALTAVQQADPSHYPDASYTALRTQLADFHRVDIGRVLLAGSASEFIFRFTAWVARRGGRSVSLPPHSYGDYAQAARAWNLELTTTPTQTDLVWACEPSSPLGGAHTQWPDWSLDVPVMVDRAYEPLRLSGASSLNEEQLTKVWQLWTPNKALGLTGVRAAYAIAPLGAQMDVMGLERMCASWPVGAHGVALLQAWVQPSVQAWLSDSLHILREWKVRQLALLKKLGWDCTASDTPFFCARPPGDAKRDLQFDLQRLRLAGVKLRDATSFGLPGWVRLSVQPPAAQDELIKAWKTLGTSAENQKIQESA